MGYNFGCVIASDMLLILGMVFGVKLSDEDIAEIECLRVVAMASDFGTKIAINWLCVNDSIEGVCRNVDIADTQQLGTLPWQPFFGFLCTGCALAPPYKYD